MKHYEVLITDRASADMEAIYTYIAEALDAPGNAAGQYDRIADAILSLEMMPERVKLMDSEPEHTMGMRVLRVDNYSIFFVVKSDTVYIVRVLYSASDIRKRLSEE